MSKDAGTTKIIVRDLTLLADLPEYFPIVPSPPTFRYIGPIRFREALPRPKWLSQLDPNRPTLYFTMGSTGDAKFFGEAVRVFGNTEYQVLITTAELPSEQFAQHQNVFVEKLADGDSLMAASNMTITPRWRSSHDGRANGDTSSARGPTSTRRSSAHARRRRRGQRRSSMPASSIW